MRLALIASLLAAGCAEDPPPSGPAIDSHVAYYEFPGMASPQVDVLIVVDNTGAMSPYQSSFGALVAGAQQRLYDPTGALPDFRIMVTTTDGGGALRQPAATPALYLERELDAHYQPTTNFTGSLADALAPMLAVGTSSTAPVQPLEAAKLALDAHPTALRDYAPLAILTLAASDDASLGAVADYASSLKARKIDPSQVVLSSIYDRPASRLDAFHDLFPNRAFVTDIQTADFATAFDPFTQLLRTTLGIACTLEPADVDAGTPGPQYECDLDAYYTDNTTEPVRQCRADLTGPCFELVADPQSCFEPGYKVFVVHGFPTRYVPPIRGQCVVSGGN